MGNTKDATAAEQTSDNAAQWRKGEAASAQIVQWWSGFKTGDGVMFRLRGVREEPYGRDQRPRSFLYGETSQGVVFKMFLPFELAHVFTPKNQHTVFWMEVARVDPNPTGGEGFPRLDAWAQGQHFPKGSPEPDFAAIRAEMERRKEQRQSRPRSNDGPPEPVWDYDYLP